MVEKNLFFQSQGIALEGLLNESAGEKAVVITHPHPLYGGDMDNTVVSAISSAYQQKGFTTLRFNFRGVGRSGGSHDQGVGEQDDVIAALAYLSSIGKSSLDLAGYSFGSWVNAHALGRLRSINNVVMVSPPVAFLDFSFLGYQPQIRLVISGEEDSFAPPDRIKELLAIWNSNALFRCIPGADHFYGGNTREIMRIILNESDSAT
jgi:uncharacterized protein